jgi:Flp pilus assembly protein TadG
MLGKFLRSREGNYALLTAAAIVPIMGGLAVGVDYSQMAKQRQETLNALDAAGIATARQIVEGDFSDALLKDYAKDFFEANLASVEPSDTIFTVLLPQQNTGGGTMKF